MNDYTYFESLCVMQSQTLGLQWCTYHQLSWLNISHFLREMTLEGDRVEPCIVIINWLPTKEKQADQS